MVLGITKNNKHSYKDFGLTIASKSLETPKKKKMKETIPYMNGSYDFSLLYGEQTYEEVELTYTFNLIANSKQELVLLQTKVIEWLMNGQKQALYDDTMPGFYYLAECIDIDNNEAFKDSKLTAKFSAYPFKISSRNEGHDIWDYFNFELDYAQKVKFTVKDSLEIKLYNLGAIGATPNIICSNNIEIIKDNVTFKFNAGATKDWRFTLKKGENILIIKGVATVEFIYGREVL